jgi:hypothetical protein
MAFAGKTKETYGLTWESFIKLQHDNGQESFRVNYYRLKTEIKVEKYALISGEEEVAIIQTYSVMRMSSFLETVLISIERSYDEHSLGDNYAEDSYSSDGGYSDDQYSDDGY